MMEQATLFVVTNKFYSEYAPFCFLSKELHLQQCGIRMTENNRHLSDVIKATQSITTVDTNIVVTTEIYGHIKLEHMRFLRRSINIESFSQIKCYIDVLKFNTSYV